MTPPNKQPSITDADREAAKEYEWSIMGPHYSEKLELPKVGITQIHKHFEAGILHERAKVDELVRALEADFKEVEESNDPEMLEYYFKRTAEVLKQFSGRSG